MMKKNDDNKDRGALKNLALISQIGISMITPIILGLLLGQWVDGLVGTKSIFALGFMILGVGAAFMSLFKITGAFKDKGK